MINEPEGGHECCVDFRHGARWRKMCERPTIWRVDPSLLASSRAVMWGQTRVALILGVVMAFWCAPVAPALAQTEAGSGIVGSGDPSTVLREDTYETPRGMGMGSGVRASAPGTSALAYNIANLGFTRAYHIEAYSSVLTNDGTWTLGTAVADSVSSKLAMGTSFRGVFGKDSREYRGWDWRLGVALPLLQQLSVGVGLRWSKLRARTNDAGERVGPSLRRLTMDAAIRATPVKWLHIAALGYNLIKTDSPLAPQMVGGSVALVLVQSLDIGTDVLADLSTFDDPKLILGAGVSYTAGRQVPMRIGYRRDVGRDLHQITAALGFTKSKFSIETALRRDLGNTDEMQLLFSVGYQVE